MVRRKKAPIFDGVRRLQTRRSRGRGRDEVRAYALNSKALKQPLRSIAGKPQQESLSICVPRRVLWDIDSGANLTKTAQSLCQSGQVFLENPGDGAMKRFCGENTSPNICLQHYGNISEK
jgi:hypothetical protein